MTWNSFGFRPAAPGRPRPPAGGLRGSAGGLRGSALSRRLRRLAVASRRRRRLTAAVVCVLALTTLVPVPAGRAASRAAPAASAVLTPVASDAAPRWASPAADRGALAPGGTVEIRVYLAGRDPQGLTAYATAVSDPHGPRFHHYLTAARAAARFGPAPDRVAGVRHWLVAHGLRVVRATSHVLTVRGTAGSIERAFDTTMHRYTLHGTTHRAASGPVRLPAAVAAGVLGVTGLSDVVPAMSPATAPPAGLPVAAPATGSPAVRSAAGPPAVRAAAGPPNIDPKPCSDYYGQRPATTEPAAYGRTAPWVDCGHTPDQIRHAYGYDASGLTGAGVTVAVVDAFAAPGMAGTLNSYAGFHGEQPPAAGQYTELAPPGPFQHTSDGVCSSPLVWWSEQALDLEAVHGMAPGAGIVYDPAVSCLDSDMIDALARIVDGRLADIVSGSWSMPAGTENAASVAAYEQVFLLGAVEGIGFYFASGDCGNDAPSLECAKSGGSAVAQVEYPAADPWVTAVGGTALAIGATGDYQWESGWGNASARLTADGTGWDNPPGTFERGSGGGVSTQFRQPFYQIGTVPDSLSRTGPGVPRMRTVPDVAADADPMTGMLVGLTLPLPGGGGFYFESRHGGTSLSCPLFAAASALLQQAQHGIPVGFADPLIYLRSFLGAFRDVTDTPLGAGVPIAVVRNARANPADPSSPIVTMLETLAHDGAGTAVLTAGPGYDLVTGVGSPTLRYVDP